MEIVKFVDNEKRLRKNIDECGENPVSTLIFRNLFVNNLNINICEAGILKDDNKK